MTRNLAQQISDEEAVEECNWISQIELILHYWMKSKSFEKQMAFVVQDAYEEMPEQVLKYVLTSDCKQFNYS